MTGDNKAGDIRIGIGGWTYEPWRGVFYPDKLPQKRELEHASRRVTSIEINGTYYGSQKPESFIKWRQETPESFIFSVKGPRAATNRRVLGEAGDSIKKFFDSGVTELQQKLGPVLWQFMPTKKFDPADFDAFLKLLPRKHSRIALRHAVEVRHESFACAEAEKLFRAHEVAIVVAADSKYPVIAETTAPFVYIRLMGTKPDVEQGYTKRALDLWAARAKDFAQGKIPAGLASLDSSDATKPRDVFVYVIAGHKVHNPAAAEALIARLG